MCERLERKKAEGERDAEEENQRGRSSLRTQAFLCKASASSASSCYARSPWLRIPAALLAPFQASHDWLAQPGIDRGYLPRWWASWLMMLALWTWVDLGGATFQDTTSINSASGEALGSRHTDCWWRISAIHWFNGQ